MNYNNHIIYYFSGTGNARNTAYWIKNTFESQGKSTSLIDIGSLKNRKDIQKPKNSLIGFNGTGGFGSSLYRWYASLSSRLSCSVIVILLFLLF